MSFKHKSALIVGIIIFVCNGVSGHDGHDHGQHEAFQKIDGGGVSIWSDANHLSLKVNQGVDLKWIHKDDQWLTMEMSSFTKGYVSVGFCPKWKGTMEGCDIVVGWVDNKNGTAYLFDYFARGNTLPELDQSQDYQLLDARQERGVTTIRFRRKWNTGDDFYDANMEHNTVRVMWAWHPEDPFAPDSYFKHAGNSRGHMNHDVSFRDPSSNQHDHDELHSASGEKGNLMKQYLTVVWLLCLYGFVR